MKASLTRWFKEVSGYFYDEEKDIKKYFLIIGNGRTGSTWLEYMLNNLPGAKAGYEFKIIQKKYRLSSFHIPVTLQDISIVKKIYRYLRNKNAAILGSKLVLDANQFLGEIYFNKLRDYFDGVGPKIKLIHLYRPYYELFLSWNCRSIYHDLVRLKIPGNIKKHQEMRIKIYVIGIDSYSDLRVTKAFRKYSGFKVKMHYYNEILFRLFSLFYNDLMIQKMLLKLQEGFALHYKDIASSFPQVATYCDIQASQQHIDYALQNPETRKLPVLADLIYPPDLIVQHAKLLDDKLASIISREINVDDVLTYEEASGKIIIHDQDLRQIFAGNEPPWCKFKLANPSLL